MPAPPIKTLFKNSGSTEETWYDPDQTLVVQSDVDSTTGMTIPGRRPEAETKFVIGASVPWTLADPFKTPWFANKADPSGGGAMIDPKSSGEFEGVNAMEKGRVRIKLVEKRTTSTETRLNANEFNQNEK